MTSTNRLIERIGRGLVCSGVVLSTWSLGQCVAGTALAHNEQGDFLIEDGDCLSWGILYQDMTYDAFSTQAQMNVVLATTNEVVIHSGYAPSTSWSYWLNPFWGIRPRLTTAIICGGAEGFMEQSQ